MLAAVGLALIAITLPLLPQVVDYGQCRRACRRVHGPGASGRRRWPWSQAGRDADGDAAEWCDCVVAFPGADPVAAAAGRSIPAEPHNEQPTALAPVKRFYESWNWTWPFETTQVCALAQVPRTAVPPGDDAPETPEALVPMARPFASVEAAVEAGARPVNCGLCGACSTVHDTQRYQATSTTLTSRASWCAILDLLVGETAARACVHDWLGFTPNCAACWVDNMGCTITHCFRECVLGGGNPLVVGRGGNNADGEGGEVLNPCLACDELHCSHVFLHCAGANRRTAGVATDIGRRGSEICRLA